MGWKDKAAAKASLERILEWDFYRINIAHGNLTETDANLGAKKAWPNPLKHEA